MRYDDDKPYRNNFHEEVFCKGKEDNSSLGKILFTDAASFYLPGHVTIIITKFKVTKTLVFF